MPFWIYDIEKDKILGLFPSLSETSKKLFSLLYVAFWIYNSTSFFFLQEISFGWVATAIMLQKASIAFFSI